MYPSHENSTTGIAIGLNQHKSQSHHQIGGVSDKKFICDRCDTGKDILIYERNTRPNFILGKNNLGVEWGAYGESQEHLVGGFFEQCDFP